MGPAYKKTAVFGHRGAGGSYPENTLESFAAAMTMGADGIELDVHLTRDGIPVVIHDERVERTTNGLGWVKDYSLQELKKLDAGSWFNPRFSGAVVPTLQEVLKVVEKASIMVNIEIKTDVIDYPSIEEKVLELVEKHLPRELVIISSFNHYTLANIHRLNPEAETAILYMEKLYRPWEYAARLGASGLHCHWSVVDQELTVGARDWGMRVRPFTVNDQQVMIKILELGCEGIITDWPDKALELKRK